MRVLPLTLCLALLLWGCGSDETSMSEYTEQLDAIFQRGIQQLFERGGVLAVCSSSVREHTSA